MDALTVPAGLDSLAAIADYLRAAAAAAGLDKQAFYKLRLAVDEIATNIISHGYGKAGLIGDIVLRADIDDAALTITLEDRGPPYDPRSEITEAQGALDKALEERPIGGLGIFLALRSVDDFHYEYTGGCNRNIFVMRRNPS